MKEGWGWGPRVGWSALPAEDGCDPRGHCTHRVKGTCETEQGAVLGGLGWPMAQQNPGARVTGVTVTRRRPGSAGTVGRGVGGGLGPRVRGCGAGGAQAWFRGRGGRRNWRARGDSCCRCPG